MPKKKSQAKRDITAVAAAARAEAIQNGTWRPRSARFADRRAAANRRACRGKHAPAA